MKDKLISLSLPVAFLAFSVWVWMTGSQMSGNEGAFPKLIGALTFVAAVIHLIFMFRKKEFTNVFANSNILKVAELTLALCMYVYLFHKLGYIVCTSIFMFFIVVAQGYKKYVTAALASVGFTMVAFVIFKVLLKVSLPTLFIMK